MFSLIGGLARLSRGDRRILMRAAVELVRARAAYGRAPMPTLIRQLQARSDARPPARSPDGEIAERLERLRWALAAVGRRMPFRADCMIQVLAAERVLLEWQVRPQFFLGAVGTEDGGLSAHVWLKVGDRLVTGGPVDGYTVLIGKADA